MKNQKRPLPESFHRGLRAFNQRAFYEAHEHFETAWRQTPGEEREFFRAFLHMSGGFFRLTQNRPAAAKKFFAHAHKWFSGFEERHYRFDVAQILNQLEHLMALIDQQIPPNDILTGQYQPIQPGAEQPL